MGMKDIYEANMEDYDQCQQAYEQELHQMTYEVLKKVKHILTEEELSLLCYHSGFSIHDFKE